MIKNILLKTLIVAIFLAPMMAYGAETPVKEAVDHEARVTESPKSAPGGALQKNDHDAFNEKHMVVPESRPEPVATVSGAEKKKSQAAAVKKENDVWKTSSNVPSRKKAPDVSAKTETVSKLNTDEMQKRWKALFSKDASPDSIFCVVKPGDSLYVLAQKNHTTVEFIKKINHLTSDDIYIGKKLKIHTAPFSIVVDKAKNTLVLYSGDLPVKKYSVATGKKNCTPVGEFKITDKLTNPTWFKTGAILPPGSPENALGTRWMGLDKPSYGIHGTIEPKSIGTQASEGCIRMLNEEVEELYSIVPVGTKVTIWPMVTK